MSATNINPLAALSREQRAKLGTFAKAWISTVVPECIAVRLIVPEGILQAQDPLGWRRVGRLEDFVGVARALGRL